MTTWIRTILDQILNSINVYCIASLPMFVVDNIMNVSSKYTNPFLCMYTIPLLFSWYESKHHTIFVSSTTSCKLTRIYFLKTLLNSFFKKSCPLPLFCFCTGLIPRPISLSKWFFNFCVYICLWNWQQTVNRGLCLYFLNFVWNRHLFLAANFSN